MIFSQKATVDDVDMLIRLRLDFLKEEYPDISEKTIIEITSQLRSYFSHNLLSGDCISRMIFFNGDIVSVGILVIDRRPANPTFLTGITGTILNVYTYPEHRSKGYATQIIQALIEDARKAEIASLNLYATESGKGIYQKQGFTQIPYTAMNLKL